MAEIHNAILRLPNGQTFGILQTTIDGLPSNWVDGAGLPVRHEGLVDISVRQSSGLQRAHFLQFVWAELVITTPRGILRSDGPAMPHGGDGVDYSRSDVFFTPNPSSNDTRRWYVDWLEDPLHPDAAPVPFYDGNAWTLTDDRVSYLTIRDAPTDSAAPLVFADALTDWRYLTNSLAHGPGLPRLSTDDRILYMDYVNHFDTYLIAAPTGRTQVLGHVEWMSERRVTNPREDRNLPPRNAGIVHYSLIRFGQARRLPRHLAAVILRDFPGYNWVLGN